MTDCLLIFSPACTSAEQETGEKNDDGFAGVPHADIPYNLPRNAKKDKTTMNRKIIAIIVLGLILLASLLACGYFGVKAVRRTRLRRAGMEAYGKKDYAQAERLLLQYVSKDPNAETEFVALANIYHELGNAGMEAQMWQTASSLNPLNQEYKESMLTSATNALSYPLLHSILGRKIKSGEKLTDQELYLLVISSFRSNNQKDGNDFYKKAVDADPETFHKNELGRFAEFMANYESLSGDERNAYLSGAMQSEDPLIRFEAILCAIRQIRQQGGNVTDRADEIEAMLKRAAETNYYAGTLYLADYLFSQCRFSDVIRVLEPYLKTIDDANLYLLYAESCVFEQKTDELKTLERKLRQKPGAFRILAEYCKILIAYMENDEEQLAAAVRKSGNTIISPLSRFIRLRVAMATGSFAEIRNTAEEIFSKAPFHDLHNRALLLCVDYLSGEMEKAENRKDPSQMATLAKILSSYLQGNRMLTEIILIDQYKKGLAKETELMAALEEFPDDALLQRIAAEYLIFNGKAEQAMPILEPGVTAMEDEDQESDRDFLFLYMLALDQLDRHDEAAVIFQRLVEQSEFNLELLHQYFQFCVENKRTEDMTAMADKLDSLKDGKLEHFGKFFRAASLLVTENEEEEDADEGENENEEKENEALDLLASTPTGDPDFTFYAANTLCKYDRLDEAEAKYNAILKTYRLPALIHVNLSELHHAKGDEQKALEEAKTAFDMEKKSLLPAFIYATRLSEAKRYEEAVSVLNFPHHAVNYREDVVALWADCMHHVIEKSIADQRYMQAEEQCRHLLVIVPEDEFGKENLEKVRKLMKREKNEPQDKNAAPAAA